MKYALACALVVAFFALPAAAATKPALKPAPKPAAVSAGAHGPTYTVKGFRSAQFGQSQDQVIAAIQKDFSVKPSDIQHLNVPVDGTTVLVVNVPQMIPAPGPATMTYIFGKGALIHVNVVWQLDGNADAVARSQVVAAGLKLSDYFEAYSWNAGRSARNIPTGPNSVSMFLGRDMQGGVVEVSAAGVSYNHTVAGRAVASPVPTGPARLRVAYGSPTESGAVTTLKPGQF
jgi:hypothetical protein